MGWGIAAQADPCPSLDTHVPPGSRGFEKVDAQTWAEWGIEYLKSDK